jgi:hypothetical protein
MVDRSTLPAETAEVDNQPRSGLLNSRVGCV